MRQVTAKKFEDRRHDATSDLVGIIIVVNFEAAVVVSARGPADEHGRTISGDAIQHTCLPSTSDVSCRVPIGQAIGRRTC